MKNIVLYAPPAAGKGTQCEMLKADYGYEVISIGQVLRNQRSNDTEIGRKIIETQDKGILTPDDIVIAALKNELSKYAGIHIVIEGFPRNIDQAKLLDTIFDNYQVIILDIPRQIAMKRTLGRVNCDKCGKIYNIYFIILILVLLYFIFNKTIFFVFNIRYIISSFYYICKIQIFCKGSTIV